MRPQPLSIAVALVLAASLLAGLPMADTASPLGAAEGQAADRKVGLAGAVEAPPGLAVKRLSPSDLSDGSLSDLSHLVVDRETFDEAKRNSRLGRAIAAFAEGRPVTVLGATAEELGSARGVDRVSHAAKATAATVVRSGGVSYDATFAWDVENPGADVVRMAEAWWAETKARSSSEIRTQTEWYSGWEWSLRYSTSYSYSTHPYGVLSYRGDWYKNIEETHGGRDVWGIVFDTVTQPGKSVWGNAWRSHQTWLSSDIDYYRFDHVILDSEPSSRSNVDYITYSAGIGSGYPGGSAYISNSYYAGYALSVTDNSYQWPGDSYFQVGHSIAYNSFAAHQTYTSEPTAIVEVAQGGCIKIPYQNYATWRLYTPDYNDQYANTWVDSWRDVCP